MKGFSKAAVVAGAVVAAGAWGGAAPALGANPSAGCLAQSEADTNNDRRVNDAEARRQLADAFASLDRDGNSVVARSEYQDCLGQALGAVGDSPVKRPDDSFAEADANRDDALSLEEFQTAAMRAFEELGSAGEPVSVWVHRRHFGG